MWFSIFDPRYSPAKRIQTRPNQRKGHAEWHDLPFDQIETSAKCIDLLFESRKGCAKWHDLFFDPKNGYANRHIRYFCRGVLHTPPQDAPKRNVWSEIYVHVGRIQYAPTLTDKKVYSQDQFLGYAKWYDTFFDLKNGHAKSIIPLFG